MSKAISILLAVILAGGIFGFMVIQAVRQSSNGVTDVVPVRADVLESDVANKIQARQINGQVPVLILPENYGRDDPFVNF